MLAGSTRNVRKNDRDTSLTKPQISLYRASPTGHSLSEVRGHNCGRAKQESQQRNDHREMTRVHWFNDHVTLARSVKAGPALNRVRTSLYSRRIAVDTAQDTRPATQASGLDGTDGV